MNNLRLLPLGALLRSIYNNRWALIVAFFMALVVWTVAVAEQNPNPADEFPDKIAVETQGLSPDLRLLGTPPEITVRIRAPQEKWNRLRTWSFRAWVDLAGLPAGNHEVAVQVEALDPQVQILDFSPRDVLVRLEPLKEKDVEVRVRLTDSPPFGYRQGTPRTSSPTVKVGGPQALVDQVVQVVIDVKLSRATENIEGAYRPAPIDAEGKEVGGVTVNPQTVAVQVPIERMLAQRVVAVHPTITGFPADGYWVASFSVSPQTVTVMGDPAAVEKITVLGTEAVSVSSATSDVVRRVSVDLPKGVSLVGLDTVVVYASVSPIQATRMYSVTVLAQNVPPRQAATVTPPSVEVIISGPLPSLRTLNVQDVKVSVDASQGGGETRTLTPSVTLPSGVGLQLSSINPAQVTVTVR